MKLGQLQTEVSTIMIAKNRKCPMKKCFVRKNSCFARDRYFVLYKAWLNTRSQFFMSLCLSEHRISSMNHGWCHGWFCMTGNVVKIMCWKFHDHGWFFMSSHKLVILKRPKKYRFSMLWNVPTAKHRMGLSLLNTNNQKHINRERVLWSASIR